MNNSALMWDGDWVWSLPLIVINVVLHVSGLDLINRAVLRVIKRVRHHRNFTALFGLVIGMATAFLYGMLQRVLPQHWQESIREEECARTKLDRTTRSLPASL
jgi:hypothetical protein